MIGETSGTQVTVVVGMPGHPAMAAPTRAEMEAARREAEAPQLRQAIDVVPQ